MKTREEMRSILRQVISQFAPVVLREHPGISPREFSQRFAREFREQRLFDPQDFQAIEILESGELDQEIAAMLGYC